MSKHGFLKRLPSEELARRHRMNSDVDALAKRDRRKDWIRGNGEQPSRPSVMGKVRDALLVVLALALWFGVGALAGVQI